MTGHRGGFPLRAAVALALAYGAAALLSLLLSRQAGSIATIWYANAFAVAYLVFRPRREWPWLALVLALVIGAVNVGTGDAPERAVAFLPPNLVEIFAGAALLRWRAVDRSDLRTPAALLRLLFYGALLPQLIAACIAAALLAQAGLANLAEVGLSWFEGTVIGALSVLPLAFLFLRQPPARSFATWLDWRIAALAAVVVGMALLALAHLRFPFVYVALPLLLAAMTVDLISVALLTALLSLTMASAQAFGVFLPPVAAAPWMQVFVYLAYAMALLPALLLSAAVANLRDSHDRLAERSRDLDRANAGLQQFVHIASHDLREPLNTITQFSELIEQDHGGSLSADARQYLSIVGKGAARMRAVLDAVLQFARVQQMGPAPMAMVDLALVMQTVQDALAGRLRATRGDLVTGPLPVVRGHEVMLTLMMQNLVSNGLKFVPAGTVPKVDVQARTTDDGVEIEVRDNGIGIAVEDQRKLFQPFQRLHLQRQFEGTGLGLALCRQIAENHGGDIELVSVPGAGSCFRVRLPQARPDAEGSAS